MCNDRTNVYVIMAHSGGDGYFMFIVHSRWTKVA